ncbi:hypothetical protein NPIL_586911 [Nephila pilipes]|uniref:Uncharacterized protein n=1 Tax=Nephila pilipes TaxID=299642 RepID=A0A8X6US26_NEPPI|nr:hypothetical protein NPIL_586911 [Nephila pilipes]
MIETISISMKKPHFITGKPSNDAEHPDNVPSIFEHGKQTSLSSLNRYNRQLKRKTSSAPLTEDEGIIKEIQCINSLKLDTKDIGC